MIDHKLTAQLRCPIDGTTLVLADQETIAKVNQAIASGPEHGGGVRDHLDQPVNVPIDGGLVNATRQWLSPIRQGIPNLIADESIEVSRFFPEPT